jgi:hypothetical protein
VTVINVQSLTVGDLGSLHAARVHDIRVVVAALLGNGVRKASRWVDRTEQNIHNRVSSLLAGQASAENSCNVGVVDPVLDEDRADSVHHDDGVRAHSGGLLDEGVAGVPEEEIVAVASVALDGDVALAGVGVHEDEAGVGFLGNVRHLAVGGIVQDTLDDGGGLVGLDVLGDGRKRVNEVREV